MKIVITTVMILAFIFTGIQNPKEAHAGAGDAIVIIALIGGGVYAGYYFSEHYEVKQKAAVEIENGKIKFQHPTLQHETPEDTRLMAAKDRYSLSLIKVNF
jgi:uncharacterized membrane-anchored protein